jgi:hypothetical protein
MLVDKIALVMGSAPTSFSFVAQVAAALQRQIREDFEGEWGISGTISPLEQLNDVPEDYGIIELVSHVDIAGVEGFHSIDEDATPHAFVRVDQSNSHWSVAASHECLEMLADPTGTMLRRASAPAGAPENTGDFVDYLVEVCDPCQHINYSYTIPGTGIAVSDFYGQDFFDANATAGGQYSITNSIRAPRTVLPGCYLSFRDTSGRWMQMINKGNGPQFRPVPGMNGTEALSYREIVDKHSRKNGHADVFTKLPGRHNTLTKSRLRHFEKERKKHFRSATLRARRIEAYKKQNFQQAS